jgi:hypothetical protein
VVKTVPTFGARIALISALALWVTLALLPRRRPDPLPAAADPRAFSSVRAMTHVEAIARKPHALGSPEHDEVRDYIRAEIGKQGLVSEVQTGVVDFRWRSRTGTARVENILARLPGISDTRPVMLVAHYDSVPEGPGAADDASGVAVLLETMRALRSERPLRNDVIFFFSDGEEPGSLGVHLFLRDHPWRDAPGVVLNFDAGGAGGPAAILQTSAGNSWLIQDVQGSVPGARGSSMASEVFRRMPNSTDFSVLKRSGFQGVDFAFAGNAEVYHSAKDDVAHLDRRSVQEQGEYALLLTRRFGAQNLKEARSSTDAIFFTSPLTNLLEYPSSWTLPLACVSALLLVMALWLGWRRRTRGLWIGVPLSLVLILTFLAIKVPAMSYLVQLPMLAATLAFMLLATAPAVFDVGWRLIAMVVCTAIPALIIVSILPPVFTALVSRPDASGPRSAAVPFLVIGIILTILMWLPELVLVFRRRRTTGETL